jgi:hypothetical protein
MSWEAVKASDHRKVTEHRARVLSVQGNATSSRVGESRIDKGRPVGSPTSGERTHSIRTPGNRINDTRTRSTRTLGSRTRVDLRKVDTPDQTASQNKLVNPNQTASRHGELATASNTAARRATNPTTPDDRIPVSSSARPNGGPPSRGANAVLPDGVNRHPSADRRHSSPTSRRRPSNLTSNRPSTTGFRVVAPRPDSNLGVAVGKLREAGRRVSTRPNVAARPTNPPTLSAWKSLSGGPRDSASQRRCDADPPERPNVAVKSAVDGKSVREARVSRVGGNPAPAAPNPVDTEVAGHSSRSVTNAPTARAVAAEIGTELR